MTNTNHSESIPITLDTVTAWARSNREWTKVCEYLSNNLKDLFAVCENRRWPIAHQIVYHDKIDVLGQVLALYSDDNIDITTKSGDNRTLLNVATEKQAAHPKMFQYVSRLFKQNELMIAAKTNNWQLVRELLKDNKDLANEKPPYFSYFLIHYIIQNGDAKILQELMNSYQFTLTVRNKNNETPLEMATRLGKQEICTILRRAQGQPEPKSELIQKQPADLTNKRNPIGFEALVNEINQKDNDTTEQKILINSAHPAARQTPARQNSAASTSQTSAPNPSGVQRPRVKKSIVAEVPSEDIIKLEPPPPPPSPKTPPSSSIADILSKKLICPLTKKLFVTPVVADDGYTYEQLAITEWVKTHHKSPNTKRYMTAEFRDNDVIKSLVKLLKTQD